MFSYNLLYNVKDILLSKMLYFHRDSFFCSHRGSLNRLKSILYRNGIQGDCRLLIKCVRFFFEIKSLQSSPCSLADGGQGVCCPHSLVLQTNLGNIVFNGLFQIINIVSQWHRHQVRMLDAPGISFVLRLLQLSSSLTLGQSPQWSWLQFLSTV